MTTFSSCSGVFIKGLIRFQETWALWTALKSLAALEDLAASFVKQDRKVVKMAMSHLAQPIPNTFRPPKYRITNTPAREMALYRGCMTPERILALTAERS